ncbi:MAG: tetratricopeptide repeat protein [Bacteroidaceae bacterium]|nr:tetratricopeptide repeat protein [Bacteroidaceae bacterium]
MRKTILLAIYLLMTGIVFAQTQQGYVKTKGRMVNGQHVAGKGLPGTTVNIQGGNSVGVKDVNGSFSFLIPTKTYMVQSVQKKGYELVDADAIKKTYQHSANPLYIVMETPEQQMEDLLEAQEQISKTLREQLKKSRQEIQRLKDENKITEEDYRQRLAKLMEDQQNSQRLIADMAKEYSQMDYDLMDSLNQRISDAILNGRLMEADSLLRSKGDMKGRIAEVRKEQRVEAQEEQELAQRQENLEASKEGTKKKLEDIASDCNKFFDRFKLENLHDSAAYYIELRAELDTTNAEWLFDAADYLKKQNQFGKSEIYYERALEIRRRLAKSNPQEYEPDVAHTLNNLAGLYYKIRNFPESEEMYKQALEAYRRLAKSNPQEYEPDVAMTLNNLASLYYKIQRFMESEEMYKQALETYRRLAKSNPQEYEPYEAGTLNNLACLYLNIQCFAESEAMCKEALEIRRRLAKSNPQEYEPDVAQTLNNLANLYQNTQRFKESEAMYKEALEIRRHFAKSNPQAYEPDVAYTLNILANLYKNTQRFTESEAMYKEALETYRRLAQSYLQAYEPDVAGTLNNLANLYQNTQRFKESEAMYKEALEIRRRLAKSNPQAYEPDVAGTLNNLAYLYKNTQRFTESEAMHKEALEIRRRLAQSNPQAYEHNVAGTLNNLADLYQDTQRFTESEAMYKEALEIYRRLAQSNPQAYEPDVAKTLNNLGILKIGIEQYKDAIPPFEEALGIYRRISQANPAKAQWYEVVLCNLSELYSTVEDYLKAYHLNQECLPIMKKKYEADQESQRSDYADYLGSHSCCCVFTKQYAEAEQYAREGLAIDSTKHFIYSNLAAALLFQGKYEEAEQIYCQYKEELKDSFLDDFKQFAKVGVIPKEREADVERIKRLIKE